MMADSIRRKRDTKVEPHLAQYAPVWLESERVLEDQDAVIFNVVFWHPSYKWVSRRYRYDAFNDVLYYQGQRVISEEDALAVQEAAPYLDAVHTDLPNSYGG